MNSDPDPRILLAAERTLLAWIRTGLALMGFGFVVARFGLFLREMAAARGNPSPPSHGASLWIGVGLVVIGVVALVGAQERYRRYTSSLKTGQSAVLPTSSFVLIMNSLLIVAGLALAVYLLGTQ